jgi:hypothetical protein
MKTEIDIQAIIDAGHDEDDAAIIRALCEACECDPDDLSECRYSHYDLRTFDGPGGRQYSIGTDTETDAAMLDYVKDSVWAFNAEFIVEQCDLPFELAECLSGYTADKCESANEALLALVEKCTTLESFAQAAAQADGRGHFLSGYDGEEMEAQIDGETYYIYTN